MPTDTQQILDAATKLGQMVAEHPAIAKYKDAQRAMTDDPDASRLLGDFNRQLENLARQEAAGMAVTDGQRQQLETLQTQIASHLKIKAMSMAQVDYIDLLRKVNQTVQQQLVDGRPAGGPQPQGGSPRLVM